MKEDVLRLAAGIHLLDGSFSQQGLAEAAKVAASGGGCNLILLYRQSELNCWLYVEADKSGLCSSIQSTHLIKIHPCKRAVTMDARLHNTPRIVMENIGWISGCFIE